MPRSPVLALILLLLACGVARAQTPDPVPEPELVDVFDLIRMIRHKDPPPNPPVWDWRKPMRAFAPVIGVKPSSGALAGVAGNVAFYRGDPASTHISSLVASVTFSTKGQTSITDRITFFARDDHWRLEADHRFQWTSLQTSALGTAADPATITETDYDFFRLHHTAYYRLRPSFFAGAGLYYDNHTGVGPNDDDDAAVWPGSAYVEYSQAHGLPLDAQASAGTGVDLLWDSRDSFINPRRGWLAKAGYRTFFEGFLDGDSDWQRVNLDLRTYAPLSRTRRHMLAVWLFGDLVVGGTAPYLDLPATGTDTYGRSARGYSEGEFRGEKLAYGEIEYRGTLTRNGLVGVVVFLNTTTATNLAAGEHLFDSFATGAGAGLRLLINKRSKTNLCFDVAFGKQGSKGVYLAIQEAF
jgi:outer membrane protein assembly factor BamA